MNAAGPTAERIYEALKAYILRGAFRPGARLDPAALAESLNSSVTPVRAGLNILVGEGLVETGTGEGFHLPLVDEPVTSFQHSSIITEQGRAQIWGADQCEQARQIIENVAHPDVRDELREEARALGLA